MDVEITTSDPGEVNPGDIARALEADGWYVHKVRVMSRANIEWDTYTNEAAKEATP